MSPGPDPSNGRLADALGAFTYASDLAFGLPFEDGLRACYIAVRLAKHLGLSPPEQKTVYYTALLKDAGCTCWTSQLADFWQGDEIEGRRELLIFGAGSSMRRFAPWLVRYVGTQMSFPARVARMGQVLFKTKGHLQEGFATVCEVNARIARRLGASDAVQGSIQSMFERWDGAGVPLGLRGDRIPLAARIIAGCFYFVPLKDLGGRDAACAFARESRGTLLDPAVADAFLELADQPAFWDELEDAAIWDRVLALEPRPVEMMPGDSYLDDVANAFADFIDLKSPHAAAHSRRVGALAEDMARAIGHDDDSVAWVRRAALMHDLGLVAIPSFTLGKDEHSLSAAERDEMRLHPYHGERVLARVPALAPAAAIVGAHHERLDGNGYYRGLQGLAIPVGARIVATADAFDELTHDRPGQAAISEEAALSRLEMQAGVAFDAAVVDCLRRCVSPEAGASIPKRHALPAGLTAREVEVLRLAARGLTRKQIAAELVITEVTVRHHLEHIYNKIGTSSRVAASMFAMENGLLD